MWKAVERAHAGSSIPIELVHAMPEQSEDGIDRRQERECVALETQNVRYCI